MATTTPSPPSKMRAWQYSSTKGGLEKALQLNPSAPLPKPKPGQHLVQVLAVALNPADYKAAESIDAIPVFRNLILSKPATPGIDIVGRLVKAATGSALTPGQLVFGCCGGTLPVGAGALAEFALAEEKNIVALPEGVEPIDASTIAIAGLTAYQSIVPRVKKGDRIFINGGSGGVGCFGIQFAKAVGCHVTTSCSTPNVELCKSLGADEVIDYKAQNVLDALKSAGHKFDHAVDNVAKDKDLFWRSYEYLQPTAAYVLVGGEPSLAWFGDLLKRKTLPGFLGGIKGKVEGFLPDRKPEDLEQIARWIGEKKVRAVIDQKFGFEEAPRAFEKLKTGRARGKIVVEVANVETIK